MGGNTSWLDPGGGGKTGKAVPVLKPVAGDGGNCDCKGNWDGFGVCGSRFWSAWLNSMTPTDFVDTEVLL